MKRIWNKEDLVEGECGMRRIWDVSNMECLRIWYEEVLV